ncbi:MAG TPA: hypothetical protein ENJ95_19375 [Bacteroidetes bacterium]|nr:hypothetical protein [Bacteroidota bacterium]
MENKNLEKNIKNAFDNYRPALDNDEIWENIEPHLKKKKKRRFFIVWFLAAGIGLGLLFFYDNKQAPVLPDNTVADIGEGNIKPSAADEKEEGLPVEKEKNEAAVSSLNDNINIAPQNMPSRQTGVFKNNKKPRPQKNKAGLDNINTVKTGTVAGAGIAEKEWPPNILDIQKNKNTKEDGAADMPTGINAGKENLAAGEELPGIQEVPPVVDKKPVDEGLKEDGTTEKRNNKKENAVKKKKKIKPVRRKKWRSYFQFGAAPILPVRVMKNNFGNVESVYVKERKKTEKQLEAYGINFGFRLEHKNGLVLVSGIEWQQLNERFDQNITTVRNETRVGLLTVTENAAGEVIASTSGPKDVEIITTSITKATNHYRFVNMPVGIGRKWKNTKGAFLLYGGLDINLHYSFRGTLLNENLQITEYVRRKYRTDYEDVFKKKTGVGLWLSGELNRSFSDRLQWALAPKIQLPLKSLNNSDYSVSQRYIKLSLDLGIRYLLNPKKKKKKK